MSPSRWVPIEDVNFQKPPYDKPIHGYMSEATLSRVQRYLTNILQEAGEELEIKEMDYSFGNAKFVGYPIIYPPLERYEDPQ